MQGRVARRRLGLSGTFLASRVGRRVFWLFLAAAAVPVLMLALLVGQGMGARDRADLQRLLATTAKSQGLVVFDRLLAGKEMLEAVAAMHLSPTDVPSARAESNTAFRAIVKVPAAGMAAAVGGDELLQKWWVEASASRRSSGREPWGLHIRTPAAGASDAAIVISLHDTRDGGHWLGELSASYLWINVRDESGAVDVCVRDERGTAISCDPSVHAAAGDARAAEWRLFLQAEFGGADWVFTARPAAGYAPPGDASLGRTLLLVALATLLIVGLVSMTHVRRTLQPLEALTQGARRLGQGDFDARVPSASDDEFGVLARSFNDSASRLGRQVRSMQVLSEIDAQILGGGGIQGVIASVLRRVHEVLPQAEAVLAVSGPAGEGHATALHGQRVDPAGHLRQCTATLPASGVTALRSAAQGPRCAAPETAWPDWAAAAWASTGASAHGGRALAWRVAAWREHTAVLLMALPPAAAFDDEARAQVADLCSRVAVAMAASAREQQLVHRATHDALTGLLNRAGLHERLDARLDGSRDPLAVLMIDLDGFKSVNDTLGHSAGDEVLMQAARRLVECLPPSAEIARPGGDEFIVVLPPRDAWPDTVSLGERLCAALGRPFEVRGTSMSLGASVGIAMHPQHGTARDELIRCADLAMYGAKNQGRRRAVMFTADLDAEAARRTWLHHDLQRAVERGEWELHYQPRIDARTGVALSAEALVRWRHPERGLLGPAEFIQAAEETDVIVALGRWALGEARAQLAAWRTAGLRLERVAVNVSARQLASFGLVDDVAHALRAHGLRPADLELEVTESVLVHDALVAQQVLQRLRALGVHVALDDFGTGYSSLAYLQHLPIDVMKVDRAFVKDLGASPSADAVIGAIVSLAHSLGKALVAEGVETPAQAARLYAMGCTELQGFLFARPVPADTFASLPCVARGEHAAGYMPA